MRYNNIFFMGFLLTFAFWNNFVHSSQNLDDDLDSLSSYNSVNSSSTLNTTGAMIELDDDADVPLIAFGRNMSPIPEDYKGPEIAEIERPMSAPLPGTENKIDKIERPASAPILKTSDQPLQVSGTEQQSDDELSSILSDSCFSTLSNSSFPGESSDSDSSFDFDAELNESDLNNMPEWGE